MSLFLQVGKTKRIAVRSVRNETVLAHTIDGRENLSVQRDDSARGIPWKRIRLRFLSSLRSRRGYAAGICSRRASALRLLYHGRGRVGFPNSFPPSRAHCGSCGNPLPQLPRGAEPFRTGDWRVWRHAGTVRNRRSDSRNGIGIFFIASDIFVWRYGYSWPVSPECFVPDVFRSMHSRHTKTGTNSGCFRDLPQNDCQQIFSAGNVGRRTPRAVR